MSGARATGTADSRCPSCGARILRQLVGQVAALWVTADLTPLTPAEQTALREPNRLIWCLYQPYPHIPPRLRWSTGHPPTCPHAHVTEHRCPPAEPTTLF